MLASRQGGTHFHFSNPDSLICRRTGPEFEDALLNGMAPREGAPALVERGRKVLTPEVLGFSG